MITTDQTFPITQANAGSIPTVLFNAISNMHCSVQIMEYCLTRALRFNTFSLYLFNSFKSEESRDPDTPTATVTGLPAGPTPTVTPADTDLSFFTLERRPRASSYSSEESLVSARA